MKTSGHLPLAELQEAGDEFFRFVEATPSDKADWSPLDEGRSVLALARQCASRPFVGHRALLQYTGTPFTPETFQQIERMETSLETVGACRERYDGELNALLAAYDALTEADLSQTMQNPYTHRPMKLSAVVDLMIWNFTYHTGQVAYIQTLFRDAAMH